LFGSIGNWELILIMLAVLLLFGSKRLPELARGLGKGIQEFKKAADEVKEELKIDELDDNELQG
jgi:sec-independent protein translocase protein TatA